MGRIISAFLLIFLTVAGFYLLKSEEGLNFRSPIPTIFGESYEKVDIVNTWFPQGIESKNSQDIFITGKSALVTNFETGEVLFAKNATARLPAASTIKIMTALVALENSGLDAVFTVSTTAEKIGENSMYLTAGERLTLEELLYGMMLVSGNDAAVTIAEGIAGSEGAFVSLMNQMASRLGLTDSRFVNATGLDIDEEDQYSTATDLVTISHYVWENYPEFRKIVSTPELYIEETSDHKAFLFYNDTNLLTSYPGVMGIKPGFTWQAGLCLVTIAQNKGEQLISVILGSEDRRGEMVLLLDYGFEKSGIIVDHPGLDLTI